MPGLNGGGNAAAVPPNWEKLQKKIGQLEQQSAAVIVET